jgi:hypothetical protein
MRINVDCQGKMVISAIQNSRLFSYTACPEFESPQTHELLAWLSIVWLDLCATIELKMRQ